MKLTWILPNKKTDMFVGPDGKHHWYEYPPEHQRCNYFLDTRIRCYVGDGQYPITAILRLLRDILIRI